MYRVNVEEGERVFPRTRAEVKVAKIKTANFSWYQQVRVIGGFVPTQKLFDKLEGEILKGVDPEHITKLKTEYKQTTDSLEDFYQRGGIITRLGETIPVEPQRPIFSEEGRDEIAERVMISGDYRDLIPLLDYEGFVDRWAANAHLTLVAPGTKGRFLLFRAKDQTIELGMANDVGICDERSLGHFRVPMASIYRAMYDDAKIPHAIAPDALATSLVFDWAMAGLGYFPEAKYIK